MTITIEHNVPNVVDFLLNGKIVAVIGLNGGLTFLRNSSNLSYEEVEAIEKACIEYRKLN